MAYMNERQKQLQQNKAEMQQLFEKRNQLESEFLERYLSLVSTYQQNLFDMQVGDAQDFNTLKLQLEADRQKLERHMEAMLATYQLNIEKLDYNYRVLVERDHENSATINQQKRKIARLRDQLTNLKARCVTAMQRRDELLRLSGAALLARVVCTVSFGKSLPAAARWCKWTL
jgi:dynein regulatry complex protein 1